MVMTALLVALKVILERFMSYRVWNQTIGFSFIAVAFAAYLFGATSAMIVAGLGDFIGAILFPIGAYFPGFTLTAVLMGLCTGLFIYKNPSILRISLSVIINQIFGSVLLNSLWISILYGSAYWTLLPTRLWKSVFMTAIQIIFISILFGKKSKIKNLYFKIIKA